MSEPRIDINGFALTDAQAMAVRVAVTDLHMETATPGARDALGPIAEGYHARLGEVLEIMLSRYREAEWYG